MLKDEFVEVVVHGQVVKVMCNFEFFKPPSVTVINGDQQCNLVSGLACRSCKGLLKFNRSVFMGSVVCYAKITLFIVEWEVNEAVLNLHGYNVVDWIFPPGFDPASVCQWKDGSMSWEKLFDVKESCLLLIAKYAVAMSLDHKPTFIWLILHMFKKYNAIIGLVQNVVPEP